MKKYFIADILTAGKFIPAAMLLIFINKIEPGAAFLIFALGELLDALDGMAAKKWPHPPETDNLWFRRNIKILESGLDILLGIAALVYLMVRISFFLGVLVLISSIIIGVYYELKLYGRILGTPETAKEGSLYKKDPDKASKIVGARLLFYLTAVGAILLTLLWNSSWGTLACALITSACIIISILLIVRKLKDGRLRDTIRFLR